MTIKTIKCENVEEAKEHLKKLQKYLKQLDGDEKGLAGHIIIKMNTWKSEEELSKIWPFLAKTLPNITTFSNVPRVKKYEEEVEVMWREKSMWIKINVRRADVRLTIYRILNMDYEKTILCELSFGVNVDYIDKVIEVMEKTVEAIIISLV